MADEEEITTLEGVYTGRYVVTTYSGAKHYLDLDKKTATRVAPESGRDWDAGVGIGGLTPDGKPLRFISIEGVTVGERMELSNLKEWRGSTNIEKIKRWTD